MSSMIPLNVSVLSEDGRSHEEKNCPKTKVLNDDDVK